MLFIRKLFAAHLSYFFTSFFIFVERLKTNSVCRLTDGGV